MGKVVSVPGGWGWVKDAGRHDMQCFFFEALRSKISPFHWVLSGTYL